MARARNHATTMTDQPGAVTPRPVQQPVDVSEEISLADGVTVEVRPISPGDIDQLVRFHEHLSRLTSVLHV